ncbi:acyl-CoA dehydrogenase family protein [Prauserella halophila]|uniref:Acyl-CoA dehydrogenase family protein n=1 Tax=Prauserella halophila TaxID=185641 RepID=A0ABP4H3K1_9PSEU|nr:acyl-CoA dehydrogenase family protein [Prauserella halophila]MCP2238197.1 acyl-CoA dehydrogenase [Prauserella halophila]
MIRDPEQFDRFLGDVAEFVRTRCIPAEERTEREEAVPEDVVERMRDAGYFGWSIPETFGGAGLTTEELVSAAFELSQSAPAFRARVGTNTGIGSEALVSHGTEEQRRRYLPRLATGEITGCFALTEPGAGSDATALATTATRIGDEYLLNGTKCFITNAPIADLLTVFARTSGGPRGAEGISAFLVDRNTPGLSLGAPYDKMGQAGSPVGEVHLDDCRVPTDALLGGSEGTGFEAAMTTLTKQRIHLAAHCVGAATRILGEAVDHAAVREQFDRKLADFQLVQGMIADSRTEIYAARNMVLDAARRRDRGEDVRMESSMSKYFASEMCSRVADRAVQILGGSGYLRETPVERFYRDVRLFRIYEGTSQIHQVTIAKLTLREAEAAKADTRRDQRAVGV